MRARYQPVDQPQHSRFAGARSANNADHLPSGHAKTDVVDRNRAAEVFRHVLEFKHSKLPAKELRPAGN